MLQSMQTMDPWQLCQHMPFAYRVMSLESGDDRAGAGDDDDDEDGAGEGGSRLQVIEGCDDDGDPGMGERMLEVLSRWDVQNVLLIVTRWDDGLPHRLGGQRFKVTLDRCKAVLEQCYLEALEAEEGPKVARVAEPPAPLQGTDFVALRDGTVAKAADPRVVDADSIPWPEGHDHTRLENGYVMGERKSRVQHFSDDPRPEMGTRARDGPPLSMPMDLLVHLRAAEESSIPILGPLPAPVLSTRAINELKRLVRPPASVHHVCAMVAVLLGWDGVQHPADVSWNSCRDMLAVPHLEEHCAAIVLSDLHPAIVAAVVGGLYDPLADVAKMQVTSEGGAALLEWVRHVVHRHTILLRAINPALAPELPADMRRRKMPEVTLGRGMGTAPVVPVEEVTMGDREYVNIAAPTYELKMPEHHKQLIEKARRKGRRGGRGAGGAGGAMRGSEADDGPSLAPGVLGLLGTTVRPSQQTQKDKSTVIADRIMLNKWDKPKPTRMKRELDARHSRADAELMERRAKVTAAKARRDWARDRGTVAARAAALRDKLRDPRGGDTRRRPSLTQSVSTAAAAEATRAHQRGIAATRGTGGPSSPQRGVAGDAMPPRSPPTVDLMFDGKKKTTSAASRRRRK